MVIWMKCMVGWIICCHKSFTEKEKWNKKCRKKKGRRKKRDSVCDQYTNACKLSANWDGQDFVNHAN